MDGFLSCIGMFGAASPGGDFYLFLFRLFVLLPSLGSSLAGPMVLLGRKESPCFVPLADFVVMFSVVVPRTLREILKSSGFKERP